MDAITRKFDEFHATNPHVYNDLVVLALELRNLGNRRCGIAMLYEVLRWRSALTTEGDAFKLNNNFTPLYARKIMDEVPELANFFETRYATSDL